MAWLTRYLPALPRIDLIAQTIPQPVCRRPGRCKEGPLSSVRYL